MSADVYQQKPMPGTPYIPGHPLGPAGGLVAHYLFDTPRSDTLYDWTNNRNDGALTVMDPPTDWGPGEMGMELNFDGANDYVDCGSGASLDAFSTLSVVAIAQFEVVTSDHCPVASRYDTAGANRSWNFGTTSADKNSLSVGYGNAGDGTFRGVIGAVANVDTTALHQYAFTFNAGTVCLFCDGIELATEIKVGLAPEASFHATAEPFRIGGFAIAGAVTEVFDGPIASLAFYNRVLSTKSVNKLSADPYCMFEPETKPAWWWDAMVAVGQHYEHSSGGDLTTEGSQALAGHFAVAGGGDVLLDGDVALAAHYAVAAGGEVVAAGNAQVAAHLAALSGGDLTIDGSQVLAAHYAALSGGDVLVGGGATLLVHYVNPSGGDLLIEGGAELAAHYGLTSGGLLVIEGGQVIAYHPEGAAARTRIWTPGMQAGFNPRMF